jgi:hypothetical protein
MEIIIPLLAIYSIAFFAKEADGPWDLMAKFRNYLMLNKYCGVFFYKMLSCYFCTSCNAGWIVYLLYQYGNGYSLNHLILWIFAGGTVGLFFDALINKLNAPSQL